MSATAAVPAAPFGRALLRRAGPVNLRLLLLLAGLVVVFATLLGDRLFTAASLRSMAFQLPELAILSLAMMIPLISGGLDLSIISTANLVALFIAFLFHALLPGLSGVVWIGAFVLCLLLGFALAAVVGLVNGLIVSRLDVSPILTTLGSMTLIKGISIGFTHGNVLSGFPTPIVFIGNGSVLGIPAVVLILVATAILMAVVVNRSPFGHVLTMLGSNAEATRYSGIDTARALLGVYVTSALLAALAGLVMMSRFNSANAAYGESYLLVTILAAVLGGISPSGGFGKVAGLVIALVILQLISTAFNLLNFSQFLTLAIWGAILLAVAGLSRLREQLRPLLARRRPPA
ncbi:MAG: ABC transporter permease [Gluconacetobacter diazotrophicus]|nr:ABC transporter permease [Gluconacetobacter diazotrophicus]